MIVPLLLEHFLNIAGTEPQPLPRAHGFRKAALRILAHSGATASQMQALSGHSSLKQLQEYLDEVEQEQLADAALARLEIKTATASD
jgi:hypothetical protein